MSGQALPPERPLVAWYGDDFTGASAVLETLAFGGVPAVLFLQIPTPAQLAAFAAYRAIGIAGTARSQSPGWMDRELPAVFGALARLDACITQYKVCSTFDSSPTIGSIGRAFEIGARLFGGAWTPLLTASPANRRFQAFGNLYAGAGDSIYRLDRHPTMSQHPTTPMNEADLGVHLGHQTSQPVGLVDLLAMKEKRADAALAAEIAAGRRLVSLDVVDDETLREAGRLIWESRADRLFAIGSQGLEYALLAHWRACGLIEAAPPPPRIAPAHRIAAVSGSCSPLTAEQISWAGDHGFQTIRLNVASVVDQQAWNASLSHVISLALRALSEGKDPIVFTASGPGDPCTSALYEAIETASADAVQIRERIACGLGAVLLQVMTSARLVRGIIAGGDTSSHATAALGSFALTAIAPTVAGAALFQAHIEDPERQPFELGLKGGQMGSVDYFGRMKDGA